MSSWDRSRSLPWSRAIPVRSTTDASGGNEDVDLMKERIWRDLSREAANEQKELDREREERKQQQQQVQLMNATTGGGGGGGLMSGESSSTDAVMAGMQQQSPNSTTTSTPKEEETNFLGYIGRPYQTSDLLRNLAFGTTIGSITGMCFGFMDSIRAASSSDLLKVASRSAQGKFVFQGTYRSGMFFGAFFGAFHTIKYGVRVLVDPGDAGEIGLGSVVALGGVVARREWRASLPYAVMLVGMDTFHVFMRD
ncbi:hypothetical protein ACHAXR_001810 [Thalassiosira sp. AJA248-18]